MSPPGGGGSIDSNRSEESSPEVFEVEGSSSDEMQGGRAPDCITDEPSQSPTPAFLFMEEEGPMPWSVPDFRFTSSGRKSLLKATLRRFGQRRTKAVVALEPGM